MKLIFYGGGFEEENTQLDKEAIKLTGKKSPQVTYIPSCSFESEIDFRHFAEHYYRLGIRKIICFPVDLRSDEALQNIAFDSDIIHLSGGNTYYFLKYLRRNGLVQKLKKFVKRGGVLTGLSAGAILMTPDVKTAGYPSFDKDDNEENVKNLSALGLVEFEFFPHYRNSQRYNKVLEEESMKTTRPIFASSDGSGIIVDGDDVKFLGRNYCFIEGEKYSASRFSEA
ncbi:MAG: type 1 glutamine amidotransferase-like domain-containing protein [Bacteriovoracaceae bacterium]|nr:type 1 glutamine amidotransferase-like domain-containing protein [Bacteriovoracaceae bacterium]